MEAFQAMRRQGLIPDLTTYNALISACEAGKHPEQALCAFQAMQSQSVVPSVIEIAPRDRRTLMAPAIYSCRLQAALRHRWARGVQLPRLGPPQALVKEGQHQEAGFQ